MYLYDHALKMWVGDYTRNAYIPPQIIQLLELSDYLDKYDENYRQ